MLRARAADREDLVRFEVAGNPSAAADIITVLLADRSVWVRGRACGNPNAGPISLDQILTPMKEPAWVLRAGAANPACPSDLRDQVLTWLALGGSEGDATFDPVMCSGNPSPDSDADPHQWYRTAAREAPPHHALWRVRVEYATWHQSLSWPTLETLARDPHPAVRRSAFRFELSETLLDELVDDDDQSVRAIAQSQLQLLPERKAREKARQRRETRTERMWLVGALVAVAVISLALSSLGNSTEQPVPESLTGTELSQLLDDIERPLPMPRVLVDSELASGIDVVDGPAELGDAADVVVGRRIDLNGAPVIRVAARGTTDGLEISTHWDASGVPTSQVIARDLVLADSMVVEYSLFRGVGAAPSGTVAVRVTDGTDVVELHIEVGT